MFLISICDRRFPFKSRRHMLVRRTEMWSLWCDIGILPCEWSAGNIILNSTLIEYEVGITLACDFKHSRRGEETQLTDDSREGKASGAGQKEGDTAPTPESEQQVNDKEHKCKNIRDFFFFLELWLDNMTPTWWTLYAPWPIERLFLQML